VELAAIGTTSHLDAVGEHVRGAVRPIGASLRVEIGRCGELGIVRVMAPDGAPPRSRRRWLGAVARGVARCLVEECEGDLLARMLTRHYGPLAARDRARVLGRAAVHLERGPYPRSAYRRARTEALAGTLLAVLSEDGGFVLEGMLTFRLRRYVGDLEEALGRAVDDHLLEREYNEFIRLLRYFVAAQTPRTDRVDLVVHGSSFRLLDRDGRPMAVDTPPPVELESLEAEINYEDVLISALISAAPTRIVVHAPLRPSLHVSSVQRVFEARVERCAEASCGLCASSA